METYEEKLSEIKKESEFFQEFILQKLDNLVNEADYIKGSKLSYAKDYLNKFVEYLNEQ